MSENTKKALMVFIQTMLTAVLLLIQSIAFPSCVSAGGDVNQTNDVQITVPSFRDVLDALKSDADQIVITDADFDALDNSIMELRQAVAKSYYDRQELIRQVGMDSLMHKD